MQRFLIKSSAAHKAKILFQLHNNQLQIKVILRQKQNEFQKTVIFNSHMPLHLKDYFTNIKELYEYLKNKKPQTIQYIPKKILPNQNHSDISFISSQSRIQFQIQAANKDIRKFVQLKPTKTTPQRFQKIISQISQLEYLEQLRKRVQQKQNELKMLQESIRQIDGQLDTQTIQIQQQTTVIQCLQQQKKSKQDKIKTIRKQFEDKNIGKVDLNKIPKLDSSVEKDQRPSASKIYEALPDQCEKHPLGKYIEYHNGKKTLFLKNKEIKDSDIQGMFGFDWDSIQVLSLGSNLITNRGLAALNASSQWTNLTQLYLFANPLTDISGLTFVHRLEIFSLYDLDLNEASCDSLLNKTFQNLKQLYINFDHKVIQICWIKIVNSQFRAFPNLQSLTIDSPQIISPQTRVKLNKLCQNKKIQLTFGNPNGTCEIF